MNISFFLFPKNDVVYFSPDATMRQALERMHFHRYSAVPLIDNDGKYAGTITEGDLLWKLKSTPGLSFENTHRIKLKDIPQHVHNKPVYIYSQMEDIIALAIEQNFVPVLDDEDIFIGIIRRREIIQYCAEILKMNKKKPGQPAK